MVKVMLEDMETKLFADTVREVTFDMFDGVDEIGTSDMAIASRRVAQLMGWGELPAHILVSIRADIRDALWEMNEG
jgi:hypothetical protein